MSFIRFNRQPAQEAHNGRPRGPTARPDVRPPRQLEAELPAVRLCPDEWMASMGIDLRDEAARDGLEVMFWRLAQDLLRLGQSVILESGFWLRSDRDEKRLGARRLLSARGRAEHRLASGQARSVWSLNRRPSGAAHARDSALRKEQ